VTAFTGTTRQIHSLVESFAREAAAAGAIVHGPAPIDDVFSIVQRLVLETGTSTILAWDAEPLGSPDAWRRLESLGLTPISPTLPPDTSRRLASLATLDGVAVGLTSTIGALADTGTIVMASGPGRPRLAWLLPSRHIAIVDTRLMSADMDEFFRSFGSSGPMGPGGSVGSHMPPQSLPAHLAFVTGPSRTADIELTLTRGVHGPREVHIILLVQ
jgi:L-lactate dehydrogenase complex protein LldG